VVHGTGPLSASASRGWLPTIAEVSFVVNFSLKPSVSKQLLIETNSRILCNVRNVIKFSVS
jgi:hypothetical protein